MPVLESGKDRGSGPGGRRRLVALGLPDPGDAVVLADVEMSVDDTAEQTERALGEVMRLRTVRDMDTWTHAVDIADGIPLPRVAAIVQNVQVAA